MLSARGFLASIVGGGCVLGEGLDQLLWVILVLPVILLQGDRVRISVHSASGSQSSGRPEVYFAAPARTEVSTISRNCSSTGAGQHLGAVAVDGVALPVHHVVVLEHVLAHLKFCASTCFWALSIARVMIFMSIGSSSGRFMVTMARSMTSPLNSRSRSSSSER